MHGTVTPLTFNRQRAESLAAGPDDQSVQAALDELLAVDAEVADVMGWLDQSAYTQLDALLGAAIRGGEAEAVAYVTELRNVITAALIPRAERMAAKRQEQNWNDAADAMGDAA